MAPPALRMSSSQKFVLRTRGHCSKHNACICTTCMYHMLLGYEGRQSGMCALAVAQGSLTPRWLLWLGPTAWPGQLLPACPPKLWLRRIVGAAHWSSTWLFGPYLTPQLGPEATPRSTLRVPYPNSTVPLSSVPAYPCLEARSVAIIADGLTRPVSIRVAMVTSHPHAHPAGYPTAGCITGNRVEWLATETQVILAASLVHLQPVRSHVRVITVYGPLTGCRTTGAILSIP